MPRDFSLNVNGRSHAVTTDADRPLLDVLREDLGLTGTKYGCGEGECGACTVIVDGAAVRSCLMFAAQTDGTVVTNSPPIAAAGKPRPPARLVADQS